MDGELVVCGVVASLILVSSSFLCLSSLYQEFLWLLYCVLRSITFPSSADIATFLGRDAHAFADDKDAVIVETEPMCLKVSQVI